MNVSLLEAWRLWFSGKPLTGLHLWGLSFIWWGRTGKILEFVAAYGVVVEIAGPTRLRKYGKSLRHLIPRKTLDEALLSTQGWARAYLRYFFSMPGSQAENNALEETFSFGRIVYLNFFTALIMAVLITIWLALEEFQGSGVWHYLVLAFIGAGIYGFCLCIVCPLLTYAFLWLLDGIGLVLDTIFFRGMANVLEYKELDTAVKLGSLVILAIGFQFDLLTT